MRLVKILFICFTPLFILNCQGANKRSKSISESSLQKTWLRSYEEDFEEYMVFREMSYDFPPSRGRTGFQLSEKGVAEMIQIAPTDGMERKIARWLYNEEDKKLIFEIEKGGKNIVYKVVSLEESKIILKVMFE